MARSIASAHWLRLALHVAEHGRSNGQAASGTRKPQPHPHYREENFKKYPFPTSLLGPDNVFLYSGKHQPLTTIHAFTMPARYTLNLYRNRSWVGTCVICNQSIVQCHTVQIGTSGAETDAILDQIERALRLGNSELRWQHWHFCWTVS